MTSETQAVETQRADPALRRLVGLLIVALSATGAIALWGVRAWFAGVAQAPSDAAHRQLLTAFDWLAGSACAALLAVSLHLWRMGSRAIDAGRFPPPGMRVVRDTLVLRGAAALRRGRVIRAIAVVLLLSSIALSVTAWRGHLMLSHVP